MTDVAALVNELIEAGTAPNVAASVVARAFVAGVASGGHRVDEAAEKRRAWDREYRRQKRESQVDSTRHPPEQVDGELSLSSFSETKKERKEIARGRTLPPDWQPSPAHLALGRKLGHSTDRVYEIAEIMREWAAANSNRAVARKADWDKTFNGFLRRESRTPGSRVPPSSPINGVPHHGEVRGDQIWFHMESPEYRAKNETRTDKYCGWWFRREAA